MNTCTLNFKLLISKFPDLIETVNNKFQELDIEYQRAIEADNATKKAEIATKKQALRDAPADSAIDAASTETELKLQWNTAILGTSPYN